MSWYDKGELADFNELVGKTIVKINGLEKYEERVTFECSDGVKYKMYHEQDCCESVSIEDVTGDISDLIGSPILVAEESSCNAENVSESGTWTFYKIATRKGWVDIRWLGESNGYYSESVSFVKVK